MPNNTGSAVEQDAPPRARTSSDVNASRQRADNDPASSPRPFTFTVEDAYAIDETGIFRGKRVELIGGQFIVKEPGAPHHAGTVDRLGHLLHRAVGETNIIRVQSPLRVSDVDLPEPDLAILRRRDDFYRNAHPEPEDVLLVIEVANTSLRYDRSTKASLYAAAGIQAYWIVDVHAGTVHVCTKPGDGKYGKVQTLAPSDMLTLPVPDAPELSVEDLFPQPETSTEDAP